MLPIKLLDCTLRDGGFCNDWNFGQETIEGVFQGLARAGVDIIEVGFLNARRPFDPERSIMPDTQSANRIFGHLDRKSALVVAMIDYGTCPLESIAPREVTCLDGIRVIFKKPKRFEALAFCAELRRLGYLVFVQPVSITDYTDEELRDLGCRVNSLAPNAVSVVDTYGLLHGEELIHYFDILHHTMNESIALGYHAHNNLQLAYANCIAVIRKASTMGSRRALILDASLLGMGKSAGNTPLELLALYLNRYHGKDYGIENILELIDRYITPGITPPPWGYSILYFLASATGCHPSYVAYLRERGVDCATVYTLLGKIPAEKRLTFDEAYIAQAYRAAREGLHETIPL